MRCSQENSNYTDHRPIKLSGTIKNRSSWGPMVWVPQDQGSVNIHPATKFGEITTFTRYEMSCLDPVATQVFVDDLGTWISDFDHKQDFLLLIGDPVLISAVSACVALMFPYYRVLKWDRQERVYIPVLLNPGKAVTPYDQ